MTTQCCVRNKGEFSEFFNVLTGVMQGDVLAPYLFIIVMDYILNRAAKNHGVFTHARTSTRCPERVLNELAFADDIANLASSIPAAQEQLNSLCNEAKTVGLHINTDKTKYTTYNINDTTPLYCDNKPLKVNENFKYLGSHMKDSSADITARRGKALGAFWSMKKLWDNDTLPLHLKLKIFKTSVLSIFLYSCETWIIGAHEEQLINSLATKCYRYILHINQEQQHISNEDLLNLVNEGQLIFEVQKRQLKKLGHYLRKPDDSLANKYALYVPTHWKRSVGRQISSYVEYISNTINSQIRPSENEIRQCASDRKSWTSMINRTTQK